MFRQSSRPLVAVATLVLALTATTAAEAQSRRQNDNEQSDQSRQPRVSPAEARDRARQSGQPIDIRPRRDGNYGVLVENGGRVREVVVDGQTGRVSQGNQGQQRDGDQQQRPRRPN